MWGHLMSKGFIVEGSSAGSGRDGINLQDGWLVFEIANLHLGLP